MFKSLRFLLSRRWRLILSLTAILFAAGFIVVRPQPTLYYGELTYIVGQAPLPSATSAEDQRYFNWVTSENVVLMISDWIRGTDFLGEVATRLTRQGYEFTALDLSRFVGSRTSRSRLILAVQYEDEQTLEAIAFAASEVLLTQNQIMLPHLGAGSAEITPIDTQLDISDIDNRFEALIRISTILIISIFLAISTAILTDLFDLTIYSRRNIEPLGLSILGEIPEA